MMTALVDRHLRSPGRHVGRAAGLLVAVLLLAPTLFSASSVPVARADDLSDALVQQQRLARLIAQQKTQLTQLTERQKTLETEIAAAKQVVLTAEQIAKLPEELRISLGLETKTEETEATIEE